MEKYGKIIQMFTKHQSALDEAVSESRGKIGHCESMFTSRGTGPVFVDLVCNPGKTAAQVINSFAAQIFFLGVSGKPVPSCPIHQENLQENPNFRQRFRHGQWENVFFLRCERITLKICLENWRRFDKATIQQLFDKRPNDSAMAMRHVYDDMLSRHLVGGIPTPMVVNGG